MPKEENKTDPSLFKDSSNVVRVLADFEIEDQIKNNNSLIDKNTYSASSIELCSYDIRVGKKAVLGGRGTEIDLTQDVLDLEPGSYAGIISFEKMKLPSDIFVRIGSKRALSYDGVILLTGTIVDPGYSGHLLFGLYNASQKRVILRSQRKICNITFEYLPKPVKKKAPSDPALQRGDFPDDFIDKMANMDVLNWVQINERVKQIEVITKDILDLKASYNDVLKPINELTMNVNALSKDIEILSQTTNENNNQINRLTQNLQNIVTQVSTTKSYSEQIGEMVKDHAGLLFDLSSRVGKIQLISFIFWGLILVVLGAMIPIVIRLIWGSSQ